MAADLPQMELYCEIGRLVSVSAPMEIVLDFAGEICYTGENPVREEASAHAADRQSANADIHHCPQLRIRPKQADPAAGASPGTRRRKMRRERL